MDDESKPDLSAAKVFSVSGNLSDYPITITLKQLLEGSLAQVRAANLELENRELQRQLTIAQSQIALHELERENMLAHLENAENRVQVAEYKLAHDPLTGAKTKAAIMQDLQAAGAEVFNNQRKHPSDTLSIIIADADKFKSINDTYGHAFGDTVLKEIGDVLRSHKRTSDSMAQFSDEVGRFGGEEFLIVLPYCDQNKAVQIAEKMRADAAKRLFADQTTGGNNPFSFTMSFGVASFSMADIGTVDQLFKKADAAVYVAKNTGRNRVCVMDKENNFQSYKDGKLEPVPETPDTMRVRQNVLGPTQGA